MTENYELVKTDTKTAKYLNDFLFSVIQNLYLTRYKIRFELLVDDIIQPLNL